MQYSESVLEEIRRALISDPGFKFKQAGNKLRRGTCPNCGEPECFIDLDHPGRVSCGRLNNCQWSASVRELYPEIFENLSHRHPPTEKNPNATADAYLQEVRGFDLSRIQGMYSQSNAKHPKKHEFYPAVNVGISQTCYWLRIINADDVRKNGAKSKIVGEYQGIGWVPPGMTFDEGDEVWITEGIFKSMAFLHIGKKSISGLSASNLPRDIIKANKDKKIVWVVAEDADEAGQNAAAKFRKEIEDLGEICRVAFPANAGEDWDDAFRDGRLTTEYLRDSFFRGFFFLARTAMEKAFFHYCKYKRSHHVFDHEFALWRYKIEEDKARQEQNKFIYPNPERGWNVPADELREAQSKFANLVELKEICPCKPQFLYIEQDILTGERTNCFHVQFANHTPSMLLTADGTIYKSPDNFSNGLLRYTGFAPFTGNVVDLTILHRNWFRDRVKFVRGIPFLGYEAESKIYIYPDFAYCSGQHQKVNEYGFVTFNRHSVKCNLAGLTIKKTVDEFNGDWINDFYEAFHLNGMVLLSWWLGTLFAEQIRLRHDSWTFLEYTGAPGSGKSTQIKFMWRLMGVDNYEGFDPNKTTPAGRARQMSQISNFPVVLLEGDRQEDARRMNLKGFDFNELKDMFNYGAPVRTTGVKTGGNETLKLIFRGGILITQNAEVKAHPAVLSRIVHSHCTQEHFTKQNALLADKLKQLSSQQLGGFLHHVLRNERLLLEGFFRDYEKIFEEFERRNVTGEVKEYRIRLCHAQVAAWTRQLPLLFGNRLSAEQLAKVEEHIWDRAKSRQRRLSGDHPALEQFWEVYEYLHEQSTTNGMQEILNHSSDSKQIAINLPHFYEIAENHRQHLPLKDELTKLFPGCQAHPCKGFKTVRSCILNKVIGCWVFEKGKESETAK
ncbi:MAG: toprim domain-containing protein [Lentisphaerota bacterium]